MQRRFSVFEIHTYLYSLLAYATTAGAYPLKRSAEGLGPIDPGKDAWADALSSVGPLVLLIGEKNTKQLLREVRGVSQILGLAFAPLGLISVLTSMIRLCGSQALRAYLGYEHEARTTAALEVTRVNSGGVHANLVDGYIVRSAEPNPSSQALAISMLQGTSIETLQDAVTQIDACQIFELQRRAMDFHTETPILSWVLRVEVNDTTTDIESRLIKLAWKAIMGNLKTSDDGTIALANVTTASVSPQIRKAERDQHLKATTVELRPLSRGRKFDSDWDLRGVSIDAEVSFLCTFEGVSEIAQNGLATNAASLLIAAVSALLMLAIQVLCIWQNLRIDYGWILVVVGYGGIVAGITLAATLIRVSTRSLRLPLQPVTESADWKHGIVVAVKNTDSMDTSGSQVYMSQYQQSRFEAVWLSRPSKKRYLTAWLVAVFLTLSFVCHYLGLRTVVWWVSIAELGVCLLAAFARSSFKAPKGRYQATGDLKVDKRCYSTGIIKTQTATVVPKPQIQVAPLDLRIYSDQPNGAIPLAGERIAWAVANLSLQARGLADKILSITGISVAMCPRHSGSHRTTAVTCNGGLLTDQGVAFPVVRTCIVFTAALADFAAPTGLLARAFMRQPEWYLDEVGVNKDSLAFLGGLYITSLDSLVSWWTVAEDRNDMEDQHKNLHGSFILLNAAFFIALRKACENDRELMLTMEAIHEGISPEFENQAADLSKLLEHC